ncbi:MAG: methionyl-tRNA formyltransferase [Lachnospiraceae bacterium]|nr:methionyl-tRNA formyltransferase [Lachnospiraceae bacterium]
MRVVFMGTPDFAVPSLEKILEAGHEVAGVVTQPDRPKGRHGELSASPVKECALAHGLEVYQPARLKGHPECTEKIASWKPDVIVVAAFGQILPKEVLEIPPLGCLNVHGSLLPKYRGAAPIQQAVVDGEAESGVTIMYMAEGLDTGDIISQAAIALDPEETGGSLFDKIKILGADLLVKTLEAAARGEITRTPQDETKATYVKMYQKESGRIDFGKSAAQIECLIRGMNPWPTAFTALHGKTLKIWRAQVCEGADGAEPGTVCEVSKDSFTVQTGDGGLRVLELQLEGKKRMDTASFLRGTTIGVGTLLG